MNIVDKEMTNSKIELLSPAGNFVCLQSAIVFSKH